MFKKISGIYSITINHQIYIGSSKNLKARWAGHKSLLKHNKHHNSILQNYYNKYEKLLFEILEECPENLLLEREQYYVSFLNPKLNCNLNIERPHERTREQIKNCSEILRKKLSKRIYQYNLNGDFLKEWFNISEAALYYGIHKTGISKCANNKFKSFGGFIWKHFKSEKIDSYVDTSTKSVSLYDKNGKHLRDFDSLKECAEFIQEKPNIISLSITNKTLINKKYFVEYKGKNFKFSKYHTKIRRKILLFDINKKLIGEYTKKDLIDKFNMTSYSISRHLNSKRGVLYHNYYLAYETNCNI